jgi:hypothetical protein
MRSSATGCWRANSPCADRDLGLHLRDSPRASDVSIAGRVCVALHDAHAGWPLAEASCELDVPPLVRSGTPLVTSLPESGRPGDSTPQHLPSLGFLNPSTVCSSEQRACLVSCRHHLWGSKSGNRPTGDSDAAWRDELLGAASLARFTCGRLDRPKPPVGHVSSGDSHSTGSRDIALGTLPMRHSPHPQHNNERGRRAHRRTVRAGLASREALCVTTKRGPHPVVRTGVASSSNDVVSWSASAALTRRVGSPRHPEG